MRSAIASYEKATRLDPRFALAFAGLTFLGRSRDGEHREHESLSASHIDNGPASRENRRAGGAPMWKSP